MIRNSRNDTELDADVRLVDVPSDNGVDPLALFESESDPGQEGDHTTSETKETSAAAGLTHIRRPIALDQVLHRLGSVTWMEAVAVVEGLCEGLISGDRERVPEMSRIAITAAGGVVVGAGGVKDAPGPILARMLHTLAVTGSVPAPLRLFVTKWVSGGEGHSIAEFAQELGYFARPDGPNLIQGVYERAVTTVPVRPTPPQEAPRKVPPVRKAQARDSRVLYAAAAAVVVLGMVLTIHFASLGTRSSDDSTPAQASGTEAETSLASSTPVTATDAQDRGRQNASVSRATGASTSGAPARLAQASPGLAVRPEARTAGAPPPVSSAVRATLASPGMPSPRSAPSLSTPVGVPPGNVLGVSPSRAGIRDISGAPIYSRSDPDVTPPAFRQPQLPAQLLSGLQPDMNTIELIVSETGSVERVRLLSTPKRMPDMMLLSGAKNWVFEPALKDGQSVRYRLELSWAATP